MPTRSVAFVVLLLLALVLPAAAGQMVYEEPRWAQWRGGDMTGVAADAEPPLTWSEQENVAWKIELPGPASATPVVWGQHMFVQSARDVGDGVIEFMVHAIDRLSGETIWEKVARTERPHEGIQPNNTWASGSAVVDGERVFAFFGSRGIYAYTHAGEMLWEADLGDITTRRGFGEGNSPGLHGDTLLVNWDQEDDSWLIALDASTGTERWRAPRDEPTTWYTPVVAEVGEREVVITTGTNAVRGYDLDSGEELWSGPGLTLNAIPSPVVIDGIAYLTSGYRGEAMMAVDLSRAAGDLTDGEAILWRYDRDTPYVASPVVYDGIVYFVKSTNAILSAVDAATGENIYGPIRVEELTDGVYASPVAAAGRIYLVGREGTTVVLAAGPTYEVLAVNRLDDGIDSSPVMIENDLYLRSRTHLYRITRPE